MDPITSSNLGSAASVSTPQASGSTSTTPSSAQPSRDGTRVAASDGERYSGGTTVAGQAEFPAPPGAATDVVLGQEVLERSFSQMAKLEEELKTVDPTSAEGSKRMAEITRLLNRLDEMISMIREMREDRHRANLAAIENISV
jgi:hypothetical protein